LRTWLGCVKAQPFASHRWPPVTRQSCGYVGSPAVASPEPPRSTSGPGLEVLRRGSGEATAIFACGQPAVGESNTMPPKPAKARVNDTSHSIPAIYAINVRDSPGPRRLFAGQPGGT